jgi:hypothetical protein
MVAANTIVQASSQEEDAMATKAKRNGSRRQAKNADLPVQNNRAGAVKGGIIVIGGAPQLRAATVNPLTIRALNPQPLPPR